MNFEELKPIISRVFIEEDKLEVDMTKGDVQSWDSIGHLNLILEIEDAFEISFKKEEIEEIYSFRLLLNIINNKLENEKSR